MDGGFYIFICHCKRWPSENSRVSLAIGSANAVLPSQHYHFYTKKWTESACTAHCERPFSWTKPNPFIYFIQKKKHFGNISQSKFEDDKNMQIKEVNFMTRKFL